MVSISLFSHKLISSADSRYGSWKLLHLLKVNYFHQHLFFFFRFFFFLLFFILMAREGVQSQLLPVHWEVVISIGAATLASSEVHLTQFPLSNCSHQWMFHGKI